MIFIIAILNYKEGCSRQLVGEKPRASQEFIRINMKVPFLSILECEKNSMTGLWSVVPTSIPSLKHCDLKEFNWNDIKQTTNFYY
jgi:hypothetical protein